MPFSTRVRRSGAVATVAALAAAGLVSIAAPASAASISGLHVTKKTANTFTVALNSLGKGWKYKLYASRTRSDIYATNLKKAPYQSSLVSKPTVTLANLPYGNGTYWWRLQAVKSTYHHTSNQATVGLVPPTPTGFTVTTKPAGGTWLTWSERAVSGFQIQQVDAAGASKYYSISSNGHQFTPLGLTNGGVYSFRIRARNVSTYSPWTALQQTVAASSLQSVRVATYNVLKVTADGSSEGGNTIARWSDRGDPAAAAALAVHPDALSVQEASDWVGPTCDGAANQLRTRQVDDLLRRMRNLQAAGDDYQLAATEIRPCLHDNGVAWFRTGDYIIYNNATYEAIGTPGAFKIGLVPGSSTVYRYAAYQLLRNRTSGATFLFVAPHLYVNAGSTGDKARHDETLSMIRQARDYAANNGGVPIVYAGDMNSNELHNPDGPMVATREVSVADANQAAQAHTNAKYNSANGYKRKPMADGLSVDHIFTEPGVGVASWGLYLHLDSSGSFIGTIPSDHNPLYADVSIPF